MGGGAPGDDRARAAHLRGRLDRLAETLFEVDSDADVVFVRAQPGTAATEVVTRSDRLWSLYPLVREAVDGLDAALAADDGATVARLLGPGAVTLPDGTSSAVDALVATLQADAAAVLQRCRELGGAARRAFARLDGLTTRLTGLD
ncbi:MAG TPA: hypothetical protein VF743_01690, partial [Acidimicrobiales bacterium]